jgi:hypothetical protein
MMHVLLTQRKLKPGHYDDWRKAWEPDEWPEGAVKAYILRSVNDPDEVVAFGLFEVDPRTTIPAEERSARFERMTPHIESTGADGVYEVIEEVLPAS